MPTAMQLGLNIGDVVRMERQVRGIEHFVPGDPRYFITHGTDPENGSKVVIIATNEGDEHRTRFRFLECEEIDYRDADKSIFIGEANWKRWPRICLSTEGRFGYQPKKVGEEGTAWSGYNGFTPVNEDK